MEGDPVLSSASAWAAVVSSVVWCSVSSGGVADRAAAAAVWLLSASAAGVAATSACEVLGIFALGLSMEPHSSEFLVALAVAIAIAVF